MVLDKSQKIISKLSNPAYKKASYVVVGAFLVILIAVVSYFGYYNNKIYPNIKIGSINLGGLNKSQALTLLDDAINQTQKQDISLTHNSDKWKIAISDLAIKYDSQKSVDAAFAIGHTGSFGQKIKAAFESLFNPKPLILSFSYNPKTLDGTFSQISDSLEVAGNDASIDYENNAIKINEEKIGKEVNEEDLKNSVIKSIGILDFSSPVAITVADTQPKLTAQEITPLLSELNRVVGTINLKWNDQSFQIESADIAAWIEFTKADSKTPVSNRIIEKTKAANSNLTYSFNQNKIKDFLKQIADKINKDPVNAKLNIIDGKVTAFQQSSDGANLDEEKTLSVINETLSNRKKVAGISTENVADNETQNLEIPVKIVKAEISSDALDNLGIKEVIGEGTSSFAGSSTNRKTNIQVGTNLLTGVLIKPGEEFSFMGTIGSVTEAKGFVNELVIKGNKTTPEVGGGLCQVSTTMFRAALYSGLTITARSNHQYRVGYYEPPIGMDATVYDPSPDLKFVNNTPSYILIQSKISGNSLTFTFYGTKDNRKIEISDPITYDPVPAGDPEYIDDSSLEPGELVRVESAHDGITAEFHYKVTSTSGEVLTEKTFKSVYTPWKAVYRRGPEKTEETQQ